MGFIAPDEGEVFINRKKVMQGLVGNLKINLGALIGNPIFLPEFTGFQNLYMLASFRKKVGKRHIRKVMRKMGLDPYNKAPLYKYSEEMKKRLGIVQGIMEKPKVVLFDEPISVLDSRGVEMFTEVIKDMKKRGTSFLITAYNKKSIYDLCDTIYEINNGKIELVKDLHTEKMKVVC